MLRRLLLVTFLVVVSACGSPSGEIDETRTLQVAGAERTYQLFVPADAAEPVPLVVVFHGLAGSPEEVRALSGFDQLAREQGIAVAFPAAAGIIPAWRTDVAIAAPDLEFVRRLLADAAGVVDIDERRVFAAGMSNGGGMAGRLACDAATDFAAVAVVAAAHGVGDCEQARPVPVIGFHGDADRIVPIAGVPLLVQDPRGWIRSRAAGNGCSPTPDVSAPAPDVTRTAYLDCEADVELYEIAEGRHGWPGSDRAARYGDSTMSVDATAIMWDFFAERPQP